MERKYKIEGKVILLFINQLLKKPINHTQNVCRLHNTNATVR